jgi:hypothetical protein
VLWSVLTFEIPADRSVHVSVHLEGEYITQVASLLLSAGEHTARFRYATDYGSGAGSLTPF